jgi:hypothetical protein
VRQTRPPYAKHGYIFSRPELAKAFGDLSWYHQRTRDAGAVHDGMTAIEKSDVSFIKSYQEDHGLTR